MLYERTGKHFGETHIPSNPGEIVAKFTIAPKNWSKRLSFQRLLGISDIIAPLC